MSSKLEMSIEDLQEMLQEQKRVTAEYITRNLSVYHWYGKGNLIDTSKAKEELKAEALKSDFPTEFKVIKRYVKN
jgi:hypothetical protein